MRHPCLVKWKISLLERAAFTIQTVVVGSVKIVEYETTIIKTIIILKVKTKFSAKLSHDEISVHHLQHRDGTHQSLALQVPTIPNLLEDIQRSLQNMV